jgi:hypothetical protein
MKIVKKLDPSAKLETKTVDGHTVPALKITPKLREEIKRGLPAYKDGGAVNKALDLISFSPDAARDAVQLAKQHRGRTE